MSSGFKLIKATVCTSVFSEADIQVPTSTSTVKQTGSGLELKKGPISV